MLTDAELPAVVARLGIPGFVDIHTHFMPKPVLDKVWAYFDAAGTGHRWPIVYRFDEERRVTTLRELGVVRWTALNYAHRPGMAAWLNAWGSEFAARHPACAQSATFYPDHDADVYVGEAIDAGAEVFKVHLVVGNFDPWHSNLRSVWAQIEEAGIPVVIHAGAFPDPTPWTGAHRIAQVLTNHPNLRLVIAHMGAPDHEELWKLGMDFEHVMWDTTMSFTDFFVNVGPVPDWIVESAEEHPERIVLGTDFPNIPHPYAHQIEALERLRFGDAWLRRVVFENGAALLGYREENTQS